MKIRTLVECFESKWRMLDDQESAQDGDTVYWQRLLFIVSLWNPSCVLTLFVDPCADVRQ